MEQRVIMNSPPFLRYTMEAKSFVFESPTPGESALKIAAKRYTQGPSADNGRGITLIFTHCIGSHKEQWEPILERLFHIQGTKSDERVRIREAWGFDWQSHGDSAVLNKEALKARKECVSVYEWWPVIAQFVKSPRMKGHRIVPLGHSAGAAAVLLTTKVLSLNPRPYDAVILIEPTVISREIFQTSYEQRMDAMDFVVNATSQRRDNWKSKEQAFDYFQKRIPWKTWNKKVVNLLTEYGLESLPDNSVILKCDRRHEALSYPDVDPHHEGAVQLEKICRAVPVHLIWGTRNDLVPEYFQDSLSEAATGRIAASVTKVKGGHFVVQENPDELADAIAVILDHLDSTAYRPKL